MSDPDIYRARVERDQHDIATASQLALEQLLAEIKHLRSDLAERPASTSSCEIKTSARGADVTVKCYGEDVTAACDRATEEYVRVVADINNKLVAAINAGGKAA